MWTPTHVKVTVLKGRSLLEKGKGGNDAYCMIGMGKEKFLTSVRTKTVSPVWDEQAEFALGERADLKITVYHKSSIIDELIGRAVINIPDLINEHNNTITRWYKLLGKSELENPEKHKNKKSDKERGEIEVKIEFLIKPKAGSMMDLSIKNKEKSLSLRNLKDKSQSIKSSLGDKFKLLNKSKKQPKFTGENQLAEQAKRMGGSKLDFLDGEDRESLASSYSSINGPTLNRYGNDLKQGNSMSRFNPARSSFISKTSSRMDNDSSSINDNTRNDDDDFNDDNENNSEFDRDSANGSSSFQRRNSFKNGPVIGGLNRQPSRRSITNNNVNSSSSDLGIGNSNDNFNNQNYSESKSSLHIAPLPPFTSTSTPTMTPRGNNDTYQPQQVLQQQQQSQRYQVINSTIDEEVIPNYSTKTSSTDKLDSPINQPATDSFASIFTASLMSDANTRTEDLDINSKNHQSSRSTITQSPPPTASNSSGIGSYSQDSTSLNRQSNIFKNNNSSSSIANLDTEHSSSKSSFNPNPTTMQIPTIITTKSMSSRPSYENDEDDDQIDWASSEDEEIVKQEVETFERNQVLDPNKQQLDSPFEIENLTISNSNNLLKNTDTETNSSSNNNINSLGADTQTVAFEDNFDLDFFRYKPTNNNNNNTTSDISTNQSTTTQEQLPVASNSNLNDLFTDLFSDFEPIIPVNNNNNNTNQVKANDTDLDLIFSSEPVKKQSKNLKKNQDLPRNLPLANSFSIDIDPFSSSSSKSSSTLSLNKKLENHQQSKNQLDFVDPFENNTNFFITETSKNIEDPFSVFDNIVQFNKMSDSQVLTQEVSKDQVQITNVPFSDPFADNETPEINSFDTGNASNSGETTNDLNTKVDFTLDNEDTSDQNKSQYNTLIINNTLTSTSTDNLNSSEVNYENKNEENGKNNDGNESDSSDDYSVPPPLTKSKRHSVNQMTVLSSFPNQEESLKINDPFLTQLSTVTNRTDDKDNNDQNESEDDFDSAFNKFSNQPPAQKDTIPIFGEELREAAAQLNGLDLDTNNSSNDYVDQMDLAIRKGDTNLDSVKVEINKNNTEEDANNAENNISTINNIDNDESEQLGNGFLTVNRVLRQSERRRLVPTEDLTSDLNSETDFNASKSTSVRHSRIYPRQSLANSNSLNKSNMQIDLNKRDSNGGTASSPDDDIKTPDFDADYAFQDQFDDGKLNKTDLSNSGDATSALTSSNNNGLPDLINQKGKNDNSTDKARKYLEGIDGVKFNEIAVPDTLKKQLEYFDRDELLQLIAYQKKYLDYKESRIKDLENYIDNLVVKIIETEPIILMNASNVLNKSRNLI